MLIGENMKHIPKFIFIMLLTLCVGSWISIFFRSANDKSKYDYHIEQYKKLERKGIYVDALKNINALLEMDPENLTFHLKSAEFNKKLGNERVFIEKSEELIGKFPHHEEPIITLSNYYAQKGNYSEAIHLLKNTKMVTNKENIVNLYNQLHGKYTERYEIFDDIKNWHNDSSFIRVDSHWAKIYSDGTTDYQFIYREVGGYDSREAVFPAKVDNEWLYFDGNENRKLVSEKKYDFLGAFSDHYAPVKRNNRAGFINRKFKEYAMKYSFTGPFHNGVAAVRDMSGNWKFINQDFKYISSNSYDDIVRDDYGFCSEFGVSFVKKKGVYFLVDLKGKRIGNLVFDDVRVFESNQYAAVKVEEKWGFINKKGKWAIEPKFQNATSFSIGFGGVQKNGLWGFIDMKGNVVIEPQFSDVKPFSKSGIAPVCEGKTWHFIQLYEYIKSR